MQHCECHATVVSLAVFLSLAVVFSIVVITVMFVRQRRLSKELCMLSSSYNHWFWDLSDLRYTKWPCAHVYPHTHSFWRVQGSGM